ncbi:TlpA family protein disulfide reductase [Paenibacillus sp. NPDC057967]|uniref:TlpA family protein disulfide reductase n=1 Tax=Paenibacillus sp. NPDC057967 TaxID=3346293 RepID=UPI0036DBFF1A
MNQMEKERPSFLRVEEGLQIGDYMPNIRIPNYDSLHLYDFITDYLLLATISTTCAPCLPAMEAIDALIKRYPGMNLIIFMDTEEETFEQAKQIFHSSARLYHATDNVMFGELKTRGYPWAFGLNADGQIITIEHAGSMEYLEKLLFPFKRFLEPQAAVAMKEGL